LLVMSGVGGLYSRKREEGVVERNRSEDDCAARKDERRGNVERCRV